MALNDETPVFGDPYWTGMRDAWRCACDGGRQVMQRSKTYCPVCGRRRPKELAAAGESPAAAEQMSLLLRGGWTG